ncbi:MAG: hypothetical protein AAF127_10865 [Pseudomonadota bacterium]
MRRSMFMGWCAVCLGLFSYSSWIGYSPFGDGVRAVSAYSRGGGPMHK